MEIINILWNTFKFFDHTNRIITEKPPLKTATMCWTSGFWASSIALF